MKKFSINRHYTHFAVSKQTNKIVNGWEYKNISGEELKRERISYFIIDLNDYEIDPKDVHIWGIKKCIKEGLDPFELTNWRNNIDEL